MHGVVNGSGLPEPAALDAVTLDANGTILRLADPVPALQRLLTSHGADVAAATVRSAFAEEASHYGAHCVRGRDARTLAELRLECVGVFLRAAGVALDPADLVGGYMEALAFEVIPGAREALRRLRARGLAVAIVSNWDTSLHARLDELGLTPLVDRAVACADVGAAKPDAAIFVHALDLLGVVASRALHIGDSRPDADGAAAAGMHFVPAPVVDAFASWR